jgi:ankyrin repeat protein
MMGCNMSFIKSFSLTLFLIFLTISLNFAQDGSKLIESVMYQDMEALKSMVESGVDVNYQDPQYGSTALMLACNYGFIEMAKFLLDNGAKVNIQAQNGATALTGAAQQSLELVKLLLDKKADVRLKTEEGNTAFTYSIMGVLSGSMTTEVAELLLEKGANVDEAPDKGGAAGYTCLMMAARNNNPDLVKFLASKGANLNVASQDGATPLSLAEKEDNQEMIKLLKDLGAKQ